MMKDSEAIRKDSEGFRRIPKDCMRDPNNPFGPQMSCGHLFAFPQVPSDTQKILRGIRNNSAGCIQNRTGWGIPTNRKEFPRIL